MPAPTSTHIKYPRKGIDMFKRSGLLALTLLVCGHALFAQDITADNVAEIVAERMKVADQTQLIVGGEGLSIDEVQLGATENGMVAVLQSENALFIGFIDELMEDNDEAPQIPVLLRIPSQDDLEYQGELLAEANEDGVFTLTGEVTADGQIPLDVTAAFSEVSMTVGSATIEVLGDRFVLEGTLGFAAYDTIKSAIEANPTIKMLELTDAPGSVDDAVNVYTARLVRDAGLTTFVANGSEIASGAVDLFAAGVERLVEPGAIVGVHSWCCTEDETPVVELPKDHPEHAAQLAYHTEMLGPINGPAFYFYTLSAAGPEDIHAMSVEDMLTYTLITGTR